VAALIYIVATVSRIILQYLIVEMYIIGRIHNVGSACASACKQCT